MVDFYGKLVGKSIYNRPMDAEGLLWRLQVLNLYRYAWGHAPRIGGHHLYTSVIPKGREIFEVKQKFT